MITYFILASVVVLQVAECTMPYGCTESDTDGAYTCDYRIIVLPLSANQFSSQPQHITLTGVSGSIPDDSFLLLLDDNLPFPFPDDMKKMDIICLKGHTVILSDNTFNGMTWLDVLTFTDCTLSTVPANVFQPIGKLDTLEFIGGSIDDIYSTSLQGLSIQNSGLRGGEGRLSFKNTIFLAGRLPSQMLSSASRASKVELTGGGISILEYDTFSGMNRLGSLDLSWNNITFLPLDLFEGLTSLGTVRLDGISWDCSACGGTWFFQWATNHYVKLEGDIVCSIPKTTQNQRMLTYYMDSCDGSLSAASDGFSGQVGVYMGSQFLSCQDIIALVFITVLLVASVFNFVLLGKLKMGDNSTSSSQPKKKKGPKAKNPAKKNKDSKGKDSSKSIFSRNKKSSTSSGAKLVRRGSGKVTPSDVMVNTWA